MFQRDLGTAPALLRPVPRDALRRHRAAQLGRARRSACSSAAPSSRARCSTTSAAASRTGSTPSTPSRSTPDGGSYQLVQGLFGLAQRRAHRHRARAGPPRHHARCRRATTSSPSLGEELGLIGVFAILALYMLFVAPRLPHRLRRAGRLRQAPRRRPRRSSIALQVFIVVGGVTRVIPLTGLTTPFLAAGGSSLVANWIIVALLLRLSDTVRSRPEAGDRRMNQGAQARQHRRAPHVPRAVRLDDARSRSSRPRPSPPTRATRAPSTTSYSVERGPILVGGDADRRLACRRTTTTSSSASTRTAPLYAPVTGYITRERRGHDRHRAGAERRTSAAQLDASSSTSSTGIITGQNPMGAVRRARPSTRWCSRPRGTRSATTGRRRSRSSRRPARILAMVTKPTYDPNPLAVHNSAEVQAHLRRARSPTRATRCSTARSGGDLNPPGSTFKLVVTAAALESGRVHARSRRSRTRRRSRCPAADSVVRNAGGGTCGGGADGDASPTRCGSRATSRSPSSACELGDAAIREQAEKFGFNHVVRDPDCDSTPSELPARARRRADRAHRVRPGPACAPRPCRWRWCRPAIANGGIVMNPTLVDSDHRRPTSRCMQDVRGRRSSAARSSRADGEEHGRR